MCCTPENNTCHPWQPHLVIDCVIPNYKVWLPEPILFSDWQVSPPHLFNTLYLIPGNLVSRQPVRLLGCSQSNSLGIRLAVAWATLYWQVWSAGIGSSIPSSNSHHPVFDLKNLAACCSECMTVWNIFGSPLCLDIDITRSLFMSSQWLFISSWHHLCDKQLLLQFLHTVSDQKLVKGWKWGYQSTLLDIKWLRIESLRTRVA